MNRIKKITKMAYRFFNEEKGTIKNNQVWDFMNKHQSFILGL